MDKKQSKRHFGWGSFIVGVLFLIAALLAFMNPGATIAAFTYMFGFVAIIYGIWLLVSRGGVLRIIAGVLNLLVGLFFTFNLFFAITTLPIIFSVWFIMNSLLNLLSLVMARPYGTGYTWFSALVNVLGVAIGVMLLFTPFAALLTMWVLVGFYLVLAGIECIVVAFMRTGSSYTDVEEGYTLGIF